MRRFRQSAAAAGFGALMLAITCTSSPTLAAAAPTAHRPVTVSRTFATGDRASETTAVNSARGLVYVGGTDDGTKVAVFNERTHKVTRLPIASDSDSIAVSTKTGYAYLPDSATDTVTVLSGHHKVGVVHVGDFPNHAVVEQSTGLAYIDDSNDDVVTVLAGTSVKARLHVAGGSAGEAANVANGLVYVTSPQTQTVSVIKGKSVIATVPVGVGAARVAVDTKTGAAYVTNYNNNTVSVLQGSRSTVAATVKVGVSPNGVVVNPRTGLVYVADQNGNALTILRGTKVVKTVQLGRPPYIPAVDPANGIVTVTTSTALLYVLRGTTLLKSLKLPGTGEDSVFDRRTRRDFINLYPGHEAELQTPT